MPSDDPPPSSDLVVSGKRERGGEREGEGLRERGERERGGGEREGGGGDKNIITQ